ncbi:50S ribosomal protein L24 [Candidatus Gottesmanbacteria bacterium RIFCSPHIGHO2_02_FULL_39_14]|uniref:Large ribosomal subunit protein uL24 n=3 Tax=Candidatus Gottesmaniibacteriota TaxID=1752720 RepID=A0A1F5ZV85_9BACT|nr:MAG: 50S ribosomal protein L24 [Candidatus Gottesmanbacteria bacterium RBG_16_38_7b]OGG15977.1 MAG: 50S ribosomal protein L24 [Candidatus Gottesmanbacteria bacterium RIFCSPHIGHO2_02_FULL_39_14]OGG31119.1 MAG: 50S ribosomal protein L24 [Candidatus Gottesmanbacteria bacterium RIFCSPLOWO2_02_FULL_38_8]
MKLKKGDEVIITAGKDKGKRGKIDRTYPKKETVLLPGLNIYKRHLKRRDEKNPGGIIPLPRPLPVANVALICPKCGKQTRVGYKIDKNKKSRICRKCHSAI